MADSWTHWFRWHVKTPCKEADVSAGSTGEVLKKNVTSRSPSISAESDLEIPAGLTLEQVLAKETKSPFSFNDFYLFLKHIEFSQQHLEFYVWFNDYESRYLQTVEGIPFQFRGGYESEKECGRFGIEIGKDRGEENEDIEFSRYVENLMLSTDQRWSRPCQRSFARPFSFFPSNARAMQTYTNKLELQLAAKTFFDADAPKELNIPATMRKVALTRIANSDSPETLRPIADHVFHLLRTCSHPNFVRLGVSNGTSDTVCMATTVGLIMVALGFLTILLIAFVSPSIHQSSRWRGLAAIPFWVLGFSFLLAALRGSCLLLLLFTRRQELPWERPDEETSSLKAALATSPDEESRLKSFIKRLALFDRKIKIQDSSLRSLHRKIILQSVAGALVMTSLLEVSFLCLPIWK